VGSAYGVGIVAGPALGGLLASVSVRLPAVVAAIGSVASVAWVLFIVPTAPATVAAAAKVDDAAAKASPAGATGAQQPWWHVYVGLAANRPLLRLLGMKALFSISLGLFHSSFPLVAERFGIQVRRLPAASQALPPRSQHSNRAACWVSGAPRPTAVG
jgi:hypothetical protein